MSIFYSSSKNDAYIYMDKLNSKTTANPWYERQWVQWVVVPWFYKYNILVKSWDNIFGAKPRRVSIHKGFVYVHNLHRS